MSELTSLEICAGAGGQALGLESAGFRHVALVENDRWACETLRTNRPDWVVHEQDVRGFDASEYAGVSLLAGGVPCPPFSVAGRQLGGDDERDLFPTALRLVETLQPQAVMLENVRGLLDRRFDAYRSAIDLRLERLGYKPSWQLLSAADFGVPQLRPRVVCVAVRNEGCLHQFEWPDEELYRQAPTVGEALRQQMAANGWAGADIWAQNADRIAPTLVGGSKKHGGADLGPTRAKSAWLSLGVDARGLADAAPTPDFSGAPRLTVEMAATLQGFPSDWRFSGGKTAAYRQVGNAFPPPVAAAVGRCIARAIG